MEWQKELRALVRSSASNSVCVDCREPNPTWASVNLGVFMCLDCSGIHRAMGVHISFVKSLTLDKWNPQLVSNMRNGGNDRANQFFEANMPPGYPRPKSMAERETFIRDKYERRKWVKTGSSDVGGVAESGSAVQAAQAAGLSLGESNQANSVTSGGRRKRIPPSQRRAMQQQQQQQQQQKVEQQKVETHAEEPNLLDMDEGEKTFTPPPTTAASTGPSNGFGGMFSNMNIKVKSQNPAQNEQTKQPFVAVEQEVSLGESLVTTSDDLLSIVEPTPNVNEPVVSAPSSSFLDRFGISTNVQSGQNEPHILPQNGDGNQPQNAIPDSAGPTFQAASAIDVQFGNLQYQVSPPNAQNGHAPSAGSELNTIDAELQQVFEELEQAKLNLQGFLQSKQTLLATKARLEQLSGHIDQLQMSRLDGIQGLTPELLGRRKQLNSQASSAASQITTLHSSMSSALQG